jgi:16S rRNA (adenine1518-N6/adenine1519-N6)-dimethyltransferase
MFQKEVAQRIASKSNNKNYGILSVLVQAFYDVEYLFDVAPSCFNPPPKVMSGVIELKIRNKKLEIRNEEVFFRLVKMAFNQRRKKLRNAVRNLFDEDILKDSVFDKRAEQLSVEDFAVLSFKMK